MKRLTSEEKKICASSLIGFLKITEGKTESGAVMDFHTHKYLLDIYNDESKNLVVLKAAQIGLSTLPNIP